MRYSTKTYGPQGIFFHFYEDYESAIEVYEHYNALGYHTIIIDEMTDEIIKD